MSGDKETPDQSEGLAVHCYAVCRPSIALPEGPGVAGATVELLADGPVAVLVSSLPDGIAPADRESLVAHARVVQQAFEAGVVVPLRFPTVAPSPADVVTQLLRPRRAELLQALDRLEDREEARLRVTYDQDAAVAEVLVANPRLATLRGRPEAALPLGEAIVTTLRERAARDADAALAALRGIIDEAEIDAAGGERDVLAASVLVPRGGTDRVKEAAQSWAATRPAVRVRVTGPLPAYSFAQINGHP